MTRAGRAAIGCVLIAAIGCVELGKADPLTPEQKVDISTLALQESCMAVPDMAKAPHRTQVICGLFAQRLPVVESRDAGPSEGPVSGDGGPVGLNLDGNGVRRVQ